MSKSRKFVTVKKVATVLFIGLLGFVSYAIYEYYSLKRWVRPEPVMKKIMADNFLKATPPEVIKGSANRGSEKAIEDPLIIKNSGEHISWVSNKGKKLKRYSGTYKHLPYRGSQESLYIIYVSEDGGGFIFLDYQEMDLQTLCRSKNGWGEKMFNDPNEANSAIVFYSEFRTDDIGNYDVFNGSLNNEYKEYLGKTLCSNLTELIYYPKNGLFPYEKDEVNILMAPEDMTQEHIDNNEAVKRNIPWIMMTKY